MATSEPEPPVPENSGAGVKTAVEEAPRQEQPTPKVKRPAKAQEVEPEVVSAQPEVLAEEPPSAPSQERSSSGPPAAPVPGEIFFIQVFSSNDEAQAKSVVDRLKRGNYPALLSSAEIDDRMMHRVRIGPYSERDGAQKVAQRVQQEYKLSTWITR